MDIGKALGESVAFAQDTVWGKWVRWILLIFCTLFFPLLLGYQVEIYRGKKPAPDWCRLEQFFIDGLKLFVIQLIYAIPVIIVLVLTIGAGILAFTTPAGAMAMWGSFAVGIIITLIVAIVIALVEMMGVIRFARMGRIGEAFNFGAIFGTIGKIGWVSYILSIVALYVVVFIVVVILSLIPILGMVFVFLLAPAIAIFTTQYVTLLYDSVSPPAAPPAA
jgi:hypothetical protein